MDITHQKLISNSTWDPSMVMMEDQIIHDHTSFEPFWPNYGYESNRIPCSTSPLPNASAILNDPPMGNQQMEDVEEEEEELGAMKEMMFKIAAMQPVDIDPATVRKPKRRNVRISDDPQSVAARHRREKISEKIRILQRLVPGGTKMDTASMLDEAIRYVKFLKRQIRQLQSNQPQSIGMPTCPPGNWALTSTKPLGLGTATRVPTTIAAATAVGTSYGVGSDDHAMCLNNEVFNLPDDPYYLLLIKIGL